MSLAGLRKNDQLGLTQISLDLIVSQYSHTLRWACGKDTFKGLPRSATRATVPLVEFSLSFQAQGQQRNVSANYPTIQTLSPDIR